MIIQGIPEIDRIVLFLLTVLFTSSNSHSSLPNLRVDNLRVTPVVFLLLILIYQVANQKTLHLHCYVR